MQTIVWVGRDDFFLGGDGNSRVEAQSSKAKLGGSSQPEGSDPVEGRGVFLPKMTSASQMTGGFPSAECAKRKLEGALQVSTELKLKFIH